MRDNPVKRKLAAGGSSFGTMIFEFATPGLPQILANAGLEFAIYDLEHSGFTTETIRRQVACHRGVELVPIVRVGAIRYDCVASALDCGALGVMLPMVANRAQAEEIVSWTRYPPEGVRGAAFGFAHDDFAGGSIADKVSAENARTLVIALIETVEGVANADEIAAVPGIDVLWLGHTDLANSLGRPGEYDHPDFLAAVEKLLAACRTHGKTPGRMALSPEEARQSLAAGWRAFIYGHDVQALHAHFAEAMRQIHSA